MTRARDVSRMSRAEAKLAAALMQDQIECPKLRHALRLKKQIENYWSERGRRIEIEIVQLSVRYSDGFGPVRDYGFRSDAVNGLPPRIAGAH